MVTVANPMPQDIIKRKVLPTVGKQSWHGAVKGHDQRRQNRAKGTINVLATLREDKSNQNLNVCTQFYGNPSVSSQALSLQNHI